MKIIFKFSYREHVFATTCPCYQPVSSGLPAVGLHHLVVVLGHPVVPLLVRGPAVPDRGLLVEGPEVVVLIQVDAVCQDAHAPVGLDLRLKMSIFFKKHVHNMF